MTEFKLHEVFVASMTQVMRMIIEKSINLVNDFADDIMSVKLYGDGLRLQQVLADFLLTCVDFTPHGGHLGVSARFINNSNLEESVQPGADFELRYKDRYCDDSYMKLKGTIEKVTCKNKFPLFLAKFNLAHALS